MGKPNGVLGWPDVRNVPVYIYALTEPDGTVRYVGKSHQPQARAREHMLSAGKVGDWIRAILQRGECPGLVLLHKVSPGEDAGPQELRFVCQYRSPQLLNATFWPEYLTPQRRLVEVEKQIARLESYRRRLVELIAADVSASKGAA